MKIAVTGSSGSVGRTIVKMALERGHQVVCIDRVKPPSDAETAKEPLIQADLSDYDAVLKAFTGCDAVIHMAAIPAPGSHPDHIVHNNNVVSSYNVLRASAELGIKKVCQASSVNAMGLAYSRAPRFDYFPLDEEHPTYNEDPYSLSKWICEEQGNSFARRYEDMTLSSMRFHWVAPNREFVVAAKGYSETENAIKNLWAYTLHSAAADACLLSLTADFKGHEVFFIVAPDTMRDIPSLDLIKKFYPNVPIRGEMSGYQSFFNSSKAERLLGWKHG